MSGRRREEENELIRARTHIQLVQHHGTSRIEEHAREQKNKGSRYGGDNHLPMRAIHEGGSSLAHGGGVLDLSKDKGGVVSSSPSEMRLFSYI